MVSVQFCVDSAYQSLDRFYQTAYAVTILSLSNHSQQENKYGSCFALPSAARIEINLWVKRQATPTRNCLSKKGSLRTKIRLGFKHL
jgi:hypothetical protein